MTLVERMKRFWRNRCGNFAMMVAIAAVPLLGAVGLAVDFATLSGMKAGLQNANDAAVLYASRYYEENQTLPTSGKVREFLAANYAANAGEPKLYLKGDQIWLETDSDYQPYFMSVFSSRLEKVGAVSATPLSKELDMEIVLALDSTTSMETDDKIGGLKTAASNFVGAIFEASTDNTRIKVGLVPFAQYVNVGLSNRAARWMNVPADESSSGKEICEMQRKVIGETNCRMETYYDDGVLREYRACDPIYGSKEERVCWTPTSATAWHGCVGSRKNGRNVEDDEPDNAFPGIMDAWCSNPLTPLSTDKDLLLKQISALSPWGETYIVDGVMWGQRVLSPQVPFTEGLDPKKVSNEVRKIMVLMTDGENTKSADLPDHSTHNGSDRTASDGVTLKACGRARDNGIEIFTITFGDEVPESAKKVMEECADGEDRYFDAASSANLDAAFRAIAGHLTRLRLTH